MDLSFAISVPVGAYHPLLRDCLHSLSIQNPQPNVALLDASGDERVRELADSFGELIVYRRHGPDNGQSDAIIEGWNNIEGTVLGWLNADDALYPDALAKASAAFQKNDNAEVVYGHSVIVNDDFAFTGYHWAVAPPSPALLTSDIISQPSCFFTRALCERVGGLDIDLHYTMDWDLWVRFWREGAEFIYIDDVLSRVLWTEAAKTGGFGQARRRELARIIDADASLIRRIKSRIGFGLHHLYEYVLPNALAHRLRGALSPDGYQINGFGRNGEIERNATLPLVHFSPEAHQKIKVCFDAANCDVVVNGDTSPQQNGEVTVTLTEPLPPGLTANIRFENRGAEPAIFRSASFC